MDEWVAGHFAGRVSLPQIIESLVRCREESPWCENLFRRLSERSPTALTLTLKLLRLNEGRPLEEIFAVEAKAAHFMMRHPDCCEGIRARILDKDDAPRWRPDKIEEVDISSWELE